jgi:hypothetical protein
MQSKNSVEETVFLMTKFKIICPECGTTLIVGAPEAALWELCPGCRRHIWETYDMLMAEVVVAEPYTAANRGTIARLHIN